MTDIIRPGAVTGNALVMNEAQKNNHGLLLAMGYMWRGRVTFRDLTAAATNQTLNLETLFAASRTTNGYTVAANPIQQNMIAGIYYLDLVQEFAGGAVASADIIWGRTADTDAFTTTTSVFTGAGTGYKSTPAAADYAMRAYPTTGQESLLRFDTAGANVNACTAGILDCYFLTTPLPARRPA